MINARPGYWDVDRCTWVGVEPAYVVPPVRAAEHTHDRTVGAADATLAAETEVPAPREPQEDPAGTAR